MKTQLREHFGHHDFRPRAGGDGHRRARRARRPRRHADGLRQIARLPVARRHPAGDDAGRVAADLADEGSGRRAESARHSRGGAALDADGRTAAARVCARRATAELRLLYVAPERFASERLRAAARPRSPIARFVVDEAHCVSEWGHDFRPDYRRLRAAAARCRRSDGGAGRPPIAAFTATATPEVRDDIVALLGLEQPRVLVSGFDRPNIELRVMRSRTKRRRASCCRSWCADGGRSCMRRRAQDRGARGGDAAGGRHPGGGVSRRVEGRRAHARAGRASRRLAAASSARPTRSGWGSIGRTSTPSIHFDIPGSLEAYYQEIGRAGRDGRPAIATLLWNYGGRGRRASF